MENEVLARFIDPARMRVEVTSGSGHALRLDTGGEDGDDGGARPMEMVLAALAGCTSMDVASILRKKRQRPASYEIAVRGERSEAHPQVFTRIVIEHRVNGPVEEEALRRSVELSATKYCPVNAMLSKAVSVEHRYLLRNGTGGEHSARVIVTGPGHGG